MQQTEKYDEAQLQSAKPYDITMRTFEFALDIVNYCERSERKSSVSRILLKQLIRSGTSVGANVEEAQAGQSRADFISKINIALKEARETSYWLRLLAGSAHKPEDGLEALINESIEICRILGAIVSKAKK